MASKYWIGGTTAVAQVMSLTPGGTIETGDKFLIPVLDEAGTTLVTLSVTATGTTVAQVCADITTAWNASTNSALTPITASNQTTFVRLTADTAGVPFYLGSVSSTESDDSPADAQTFSKATTTANTGTTDFNTAANWSDSAVPGAGDEVVVDYRGASYGILYGLNQSSITLASLRVYMGAPAIGNIMNGKLYALKISATLAEVGANPADGSSISGTTWYLDFGTNATDAYVQNGNNQSSGGYAPIVLAGSHASNRLTINGGTVWVGKRVPGESASFPTITVSAGSLNTGSGTSWTTVTVLAGAVVLEKGSASGTINVRGGTARTEGSTKVGTANAYSGTYYPNHRLSGDDIDTLNMRGGIVNWSQNSNAATIATFAVYEGGSLIIANASQLTLTAKTYDFTNDTSLSVSIAS